MIRALVALTRGDNCSWLAFPKVERESLKINHRLNTREQEELPWLKVMLAKKKWIQTGKEEI